MRMSRPATRRGSQAESRLARVIGPSIMMTVLSLLSTILSFVYQLMVARQFGAQAEMDAYLAVMAIPNYVVLALLAPLSFAFIPAFVERIAKGADDDAWRIAATLLKLVPAVLAVLCLIGMASAPQLVGAIAPGMTGDQRQLAIALLRILLPSMIFSGTFALLSNICCSLRSFALPSLAPVLYVVVNVLVLWALGPSWGIGSVALGTTLGQAAQVALLTPKVLRVGKNLQSLDLAHPGLMQVFRLTLPLMVVGVVAQSTDLIERSFASRLPEGSISYLGYALRILSPVSTILASGVVTAIFPLMAQQATAHRCRPSMELRETVAQGLSLLIFVLLPVAAWLAALCVPIITLILERGAYGHEATLGTATALLCYLGYFVINAVDNVATRVFYVLKDTTTPAALRVIGIVVYVALCELLVRRLSFVGLALALSLYCLFVALADIALASRKLGGLPWKQLCTSQAKTVAASIALAGVARFAWAVLTAEHMSMLASVLIASIGGAGAFLIMAFVLRSDDLRSLQGYVQSKLTNRSRLPEREEACKSPP